MCKCNCLGCRECETLESASTVIQQPPTGDGPVIVDQIIVDLEARKEFGTQKYGTPLRAFNGRNPAIDAYQEALDFVQYTKQMVIEFEVLQGALAAAEAEIKRLNKVLNDFGYYDNEI